MSNTNATNTAAYGGRYVPDGSPSAQGGMGLVEICTDPQLNRKVAIKFLLPGKDKKRILDEVRALQAIRSKHVVQLYDVVIHQPGNNIGIVQEYLEGDDLTGFWKTSPKPPEFLRVLYQLARGLEDIHDQDRIHRDIKPNNIKRDRKGPQGLLKIFDFGLARSDEEQDAQTRGQIGTDGFMAPELYASGIVKFTKAVDVFAFAATAICLAGKGKPPPELLSKVTQPIDPDGWVQTRGFSSLAMGIPPPVCALLNACLSSKPQQRPTMREVRTLIEAHLVAGQHRALLTWTGGTYTCDGTRRSVIVQKDPHGKVTINYDGLGFFVYAVQGAVYLNNATAAVGMRIPESCVLTIGLPSAGTQRLFVTVDISRPEVVVP